MRLSTIDTASISARETGCRWLEQVYGRARSLETQLGAGEVGDFLPGLGELRGWGLIDEGIVSGAILTGFAPAPESVSILLTAQRAGNLLRISSLAGLSSLPAGCLDEIGIRSLLSSGPCRQVLDRGKVILETRSVEAAALCRELAQHLVRGPVIEEAAGTVEPRAELLVACDERGVVTDFAMGPMSPAKSQWVAIADWGS